jgi:hypothetical protein
MSPVWYRYTPGGLVELTTEPDAEKTTLLAAAGRAALCVQREDAPYAYVTVEGPVTIGPATDEVRIDIASRYLGAKAGPRYVERGSGEDVLVTLSPERWHTVDFAKLGHRGSSAVADRK